MKQRPILVAIIGYIIGILWGLYFKFSIVPFYILIIAMYFIFRKPQKKFKLISISRYIRYFKLIVDEKAILILIIFSMISNTIISYQNNQYENIYKDGQNIKIEGIVNSQKTEKQYYNLYQIKLINSNFNMYIQVSKSKELEYGDKVQIEGIYQKPEKQRNYGGYDESKYLKTLKVIGRIKVNNIKVEEKKQLNFIFQLANKTNLQVKENIEKSFDSEKAGILKGLLLGDKQDIDEDVKNDFQILNISHILAISGMHIGYIILAIQLLFKKLLGKKKTKIVTIIVLICYMFITGFSPSIVRASIMGCLVLISGFVNRKNDIWNSIAISLFIILIYNPFSILNIGLQLSYLGTIGIILFYPTLTQIQTEQKTAILGKIKEILAVTISAQIMILPIIILNFHMIGIYSLISNLFISLIIGPIIILAFLCIIPIFKILNYPLKFALDILILISKLSNLPFSKIYIPTPSIFSIILYFMIVLLARYIYKIYTSNHVNATYKRIKNLIALVKYRFNQKRKKYCICIVIILVTFIGIKLIPKDLGIYFIDVNQGDCTFIVTPRKQNNTNRWRRGCITKF